MATSVRLDPATEARLDRLASETGRTKAFYLRELIEQGLDDLEDAYLGAAALEPHRRSGEPTIPMDQLVSELGLTLAFISHDLSVIRRLCQRTLVLHQGKIVEDRPTADLFAAPGSAYTRDLLEAIPLPDPSQPWF